MWRAPGTCCSRPPSSAAASSRCHKCTRGSACGFESRDALGLPVAPPTPEAKPDHQRHGGELDIVQGDSGDFGLEKQSRVPGAKAIGEPSSRAESHARV